MSNVIEIEPQRDGAQPQVVVVVMPVQAGGVTGDGGVVYEVHDVHDEREAGGALANALRTNSHLAWWSSIVLIVLIVLQLWGG